MNRAIPTLTSKFDARAELDARIKKGEALLDILSQAFEAYKEDRTDVEAVSMMYAIYARAGFFSWIGKVINEFEDQNEQPLIVWKKAMLLDLEFSKERIRRKGTNLYALVKLEIPAGAKIVRCLFSKKCRTDIAKVVSITSLDEKETYDFAMSWYNPQVNYIVGETIRPDYFDRDPTQSCSFGIHFFEDKQDAIDYNFN